MRGLNELAPKAKARRFRTLLPMIEAKIEAGVRHADIIRGAPVFFYLGSDREPGALIVGQPILKLAGVMRGSFLDEQPVMALETARIAVAPSNMGIAAVVPAYKVLEILEGWELTARRQRK